MSSQRWRVWRRERQAAVEPEADMTTPQAFEVSIPDGFLFDGAYTTNREYLVDELAWVDFYIRAHVQRWHRALAAHRPEEDWGSPKISKSEIDAYLRSRLSLSFLAESSSPDEVEQALLDQARRWRDHIDRRLTNTPPEEDLRLHRLRTRYGLSDFEVGLLLVCLLGEIDWRYRNLYSYLQDEQYRTQPSVALATDMLTLGQPSERSAAFGAGEPLPRYHLITLDPDSRTSQFALNSIHLDRRALHFLLGDNAPDPALTGIVYRETISVSWNQLFLDSQHLDRLKVAKDEWERDSTGGMVLIFHGPQGSGRLKAAEAFCLAAGTGLLVADVGAALGWPGGWQVCVDRCFREAEFQRVAVYWAGLERLNEAANEVQRAYLLRATAAFGGLAILATTDLLDAASVLHDKRLTHFDFPMPDLAMRERIWTMYWSHDPELAHQLAGTFRLTEEQVKDAVTAADSLARRRNPGHPTITREDLYEGARQQAARRLVGLARRVDPVPERTFDDLVLPPAIARQVGELNQRIHRRRDVLERLGFERRLPLGKGLIVLFTGASGTGKTMTASLLAEAQGVSLFKVDMAALVSKWVGETEKNLSRLFDQAEYTDAILFFDEADSIFGRRGEVKEAQDRWANMEVNYLLQRIEEFSGVVILTTNLRQNIDEAFLRRIHVIIDFPFPNEEERESIWRHTLPVQPGVLAVENFEQTVVTLAQAFPVTGGSIKNIVVDAAFRACADGSRGEILITRRHLVAATAREYQKLGKPITQADFGQEFYGWIKEDILAVENDRSADRGETINGQQ